jgi:hypothetical protein
MTVPEMRHAALAGYKKGERFGFTNTSVYILWFDRFIVRCHVRMGDETRQYRAFNIELILAIQMFLEEDLLKCQSMEAMLNVSLGVFLIAGLCGGLRVEELSLLSLDATAKYLSAVQPRSPELANVCLALIGRVKGGGPGRGLSLITYISCHCIRTDPPRVGTYGRGGLCKYGYHKWLDVSKQKKGSREDVFLQTLHV